MIIHDYKVTCLFNYFKEVCRFWKYEMALLGCCSLAEQKVVLRGFYRNQTFTRDSLIGRQSSLENKKEFGLIEIILGYKDFYIASIASLLTLYLERYFTSDLSFSVSEVKVLVYCLASFVVLTFIFSIIEKIKYRLKEIPLKEIFAFESELVKEALADGKEKIDFDVLMENVEKKFKV